MGGVLELIRGKRTIKSCTKQGTDNKVQICGNAMHVKIKV